MKKILYILSFVICLTSCVTRNRCNDKFPPQIFTKDSIVLKDTIIYKDTIINTPAETITTTQYIRDTLVLLDTVIFGNKTQLHLQYAKGKLKASCTADSLQFVINNLQKIISNQQHFTTTIKTIQVPVDKPYIPKWLIIALILSVGYSCRNILLTGIKKLLL